MHACPECGMACDCDGEDLWHDWPFNLDCTHECEDEDDDLYLDDDTWSKEPINPLAEKLGISIEKAGVWRITPDGLERIEEQSVIRAGQVSHVGSGSYVERGTNEPTYQLRFDSLNILAATTGGDGKADGRMPPK